MSKTYFNKFGRILQTNSLKILDGFTMCSNGNADLSDLDLFCSFGCWFWLGGFGSLLSERSWKTVSPGIWEL